MRRWIRPAKNLGFCVLGALAYALLLGITDPVNERVIAEKREAARARIESMPPAVRLGHPLEGAMWVEHSGNDDKGRPMRERRYTGAADLR